MATAHKIHVLPTDSGVLKFDQNSTTMRKVNELLQEDLEDHHAFFNAAGYHNHITHHLLSLYGTGAGVEALQRAYRSNISYQVQLKPPQSRVLDELRADYASASPLYLGKGTCFPDFLVFFQEEMDNKGWQEVVREYLFSDTDASLDLLGRLYGGIVHPLIQFMFGIEWKQPAIVASALAQAAVHKNDIGPVLVEVETLAKKRNPAYVPLGTLIDELTTKKSPEIERLVGSADRGDSAKITDGVFTRVRAELVDFVSRIKVRDHEIEERTAEMIHTSAYIAASAALRPPHIPKFDFFLIHHLNVSPIFLSLNKLEWIPSHIKTRLLEWKMRLDVMNYIAQGSPPLRLDLLRSYNPRDGTLVSRPEELLPRFHAIDDDGHTIKVTRALLIAQQVSQGYVHRNWLRFGSDRDWLMAHYLLLDGVEGPGATWVRSAGFPEAWEDVPEVA